MAPIPMPTSRPDRRPTVGRHDALAEVRWLVDGPAAGAARVLVVEGEAGIGKSHLAGEACDLAATAGLSVLVTGADEVERDRAGHVLLDLVAGPAYATATDRLPLLSGLALVDAAGDAVEHAARNGLLAVVEDLQWADDLSARGLAGIVRRVATLPVALLVTRRAGAATTAFDTALARTSIPTRHLRLEALAPSDVAALAAGVLGGPADAALSRRLATAGGNPLFVLELLAARRGDRGGATLITEGAETDGAETDADLPELPDSLRRTVLGRLGSLPQATIDVVRIASVLGRATTLADLAVVSGSSVVDLASVLRPALDQSLLTGVGDDLAFRHDLVREAIYEDMAPAVRRDLHLAAGRALAASGRPVDLSAAHLVVGARPGDLDAAAWLAAAAIAVSTLDPTASVRLFERSLVVGGDQWPQRGRTVAALLEPLAVVGRVHDARHIATELLGASIDPSTALAVRRALAVVSAHSGDLISAAAENADAAATAVQVGQRQEAEVLDTLAASMGLLAGRAASDVRAVAHRALASAAADANGDATTDEVRAVAHQTLALVDGVAGCYHDAVAHAVTSRRLQTTHDLPSRGFLIPDVWEGTFLLCADRFDEALAALTSAHERAVRRGASSLLVQTHSATGLAHALAARWDDAVAELETALDVAVDTGNHSHVAAGHAVLARLALARGDTVESHRRLAAALEAAAGAGHLVGVELRAWAVAAALEMEGDPGAALAVLAETWKQVGTLRGLVQYRTIGLDLVRLACRLDAREVAAAVTADVETLAGSARVASADAVALACRGLLDGDPDRLLRGVVASRGSPHRYAHAAICSDTADLLFARGRREEAAPLVEEAAAVLVSCGAAADLARLDALARGHGVRRRRAGRAPARFGWDALSATERRVVDLVADGLTNPQIAARLFISRRTVETHLAHVFRKLGLTNRTQLATATVRRRNGAVSPDAP